jgi:ESS family glutamate:Na+ symporter
MDFSDTNTALWNFVVQMGILAAILLAANILKRKVPGIKKTLMPTAVLAGFIALALRMSGVIKLNAALMEMVTYHTIAIGFIALSLIIPKKEGNYSKAFTGSKTGALIVSTYLLQGAIGLIVSIGLAYTIRPGLFKAAGVLLPMGYGQGPGQANNVGSTYEAMGFYGGQSFGLSIAAMGFVVARVVGVIYLNVLKRKNLLRRANDKTAQRAASVDDFENWNEIPVSESVDRFSIQVALVLIVYLATWGLALGLTKMLRTAGTDFATGLIPLIWGFNFIFGSLLAVLLRGIIRLFRNTGLMTRQYQNNYLLARISGYSFDIMIITGICTINFEKLSGLWLPFILMCSIGGAATFVYLKWICKKLYPDYYYEGFLSMFGMMTGVISSGILLLREADPKFETPAANNLVLGSSFAIGFGIPMLVLIIPFAPKSDLMAVITLGCCIVYFAILLLYMILVKPKEQKAQ